MIVQKKDSFSVGKTLSVVGVGLCATGAILSFVRTQISEIPNPHSFTKDTVYSELCGFHPMPTAPHLKAAVFCPAKKL